jgi:predicted DNA-binding transcriptional regulator AlpA
MKQNTKKTGESETTARDIYRVNELAARTGYSPDFYWKKIREGKIRVLPFGSSVAVPASEYERICRDGIE